MPYFLEILLSQHNCTVRKEDIVLCKLLITLIIILTITLTTSTSTPIKVTFTADAYALMIHLQFNVRAKQFKCGQYQQCMYVMEVFPALNSSI